MVEIFFNTNFHELIENSKNAPRNWSYFGQATYAKNVLPEPTVDGRKESQLQSGSIEYQDLQSAKIVISNKLTAL